MSKSKLHKKKIIRPLGHITSDMEPLLQEMLFEQEMQVHEIIGIILQYAQTHSVGIEKYEDGSVPVSYYGHADGLAK